VQLGLENKKKTIWAAALGGLALLLFAYEFIPMFMGTNSDPSGNAEAAAPAAVRVTARTNNNGRPGKKVKPENLDPTLRLNLLAASEQTKYEGNGRNIFVSQSEDVVIPTPLKNGLAPGSVQAAAAGPIYVAPSVPAPPPIPLKFFGFASRQGEPKKIFLEQGEDVWVAGEGEIVDRRYKVVRIANTSVEIQDVVNSGPPQTIPLTQG
jgi:hypothetical protein